MNFDASKWPSNTALIKHIIGLCHNTLAAYRADAILVQEHSNLERSVAQGSYGRRQIYELIQNGADALLDEPGGRIQVVLTQTHLYCANEGNPIDEEGVEAILHSNLSVKRGNEIGRFGLGFKSVLGVTQQPQFFCRSGSFGFNAERAAKEIGTILPSAKHYPVLRLAYPLDPVQLAGKYPILRELMSWATTVVMLERDPERSSWLEKDVSDFPAEFLLFCSHVGKVILENRANGLSRILRIKTIGDSHALTDGKSERTWRVFRATHKPSVEARKEAGELAGRKELPVIWAVPTEGRLSIGQFWAFFPLRDETTLSGIVNAPWKTNDDRTSLQQGCFNDELLGTVSELVTNGLADLIKKNDPGWILDVLPARGREARCWADEQLTLKTYARAAQSPSLPDQECKLRCPGDISLHPEYVPREILDLWAAQPDRPLEWCHPSVEGRERRPRAERLMALAKKSAKSIPDWLHALIPETPKPVSLGPSIKVAGALNVFDKENPEPGRSTLIPAMIRMAWILMDDEGNRAQPLPDKIFLPTGHQIETNTIRLVHPDLVGDETVVNAIAALGIQPVTPELELDAVLSHGFARWTDEDWARFWELVRRASTDRAAEILNSHAPKHDQPGLAVSPQVKVRTLAGAFEVLRKVLLPGPIVPDDGSRDACVTIDTKYHKEELGVIVKIGASNTPLPSCGLMEGEVFRAYKHDRISYYIAVLPAFSPSLSRPNINSLEFKEKQFAGPLEPLEILSDEGKAHFSEALLLADTKPGDWTLKHRASRQYPEMPFGPPTIWAIGRYGRIITSLGPYCPDEAVSPTLNEWGSFLPVAKCSAASAVILGLPDKLEGLGAERWRQAFEQALTTTDDQAIGRFYGQAALYRTSAPPLLRCRVGQSYQSLPSSEVTVVSMPHEFKALVAIDKPVILAENENLEKLLVGQWKCRPAEREVRTQVSYIPAGETVPIVDQFPAMQWHLKDEHKDLQLVPCAELRRETLTEKGKSSEPREFWHNDNTVYWLEQLGVPRLLEYLDGELGLLLSAEQRDAILEQRADQDRRRRFLKIRKQASEASKLLVAIGEKAIRPRLPAALVQAVEIIHGPLTPNTLAELAIVVYGVAVLREFREELENADLQPPLQWAGSSHARKYVANLGFPRAYAGYGEIRREPVLSVDGPSKLPPLHSFQFEIKNKIRRLLTAPEDDRRGLLSLPTGAGKTRVAVQAIIESLRESQLAGPVLWVAQSDELCEQAVQTWREVWRAEGAQEPLQISRLWAQNDAEEADGAPYVVVATIQKLGNCIKEKSYDWLANASMVIIDEAHSAVTPAYTEVLTWEGIGRAGTRCPLLGLTATPFRGRSEDETKRLVTRFGKFRLDAGLKEEPSYRHLQDIGVLSQVEHRLLDGMQVSLSEAELDELVKLSKVPSSVYDRIAADSSRNQILLKDIAGQPRDWPILLFAASVEHAQTMAALLSMEGIRAAPISATTEPGARRECIRAFKRGQLQVLTNYNVLTQGFDAPATRAIYVARPTFSPNQYQQMIGRGLRGPKNGGKETCLIVNVEDNFVQYGEKLAFLEFEYLWQEHE